MSDVEWSWIKSAVNNYVLVYPLIASIVCFLIAPTLSLLFLIWAFVVWATATHDRCKRHLEGLE